MDRTELIQKQKLLKQKINDADAVLVGIGEEFNESFGDIDKFPRLISVLDRADRNRSLEWIVPYIEKLYIMEHADERIEQAYAGLYRLIKDKNYFIVTTCIDGKIKKADFDTKRIVEPCGSYDRLQCSGKECGTLLHETGGYMESIRRALETDNDKELMALQPRCPVCGEPLVFNNVVCEGKYNEEGYKAQWEAYTEWLKLTLNKKLCILELGVGLGMPDIIRWPFEKAAFYNKKADFFRINETLYQMTKDLGDKGVSIAMNSVDFLQSCCLSDGNN